MSASLVGSEMCIRDSSRATGASPPADAASAPLCNLDWFYGEPGARRAGDVTVAECRVVDHNLRNLAAQGMRIPQAGA
eukprot:10432912-Alexandrium_andersonii.AAC.1